MHSWTRRTFWTRGGVGVVDFKFLIIVHHIISIVSALRVLLKELLYNYGLVF